jgi:hypothetical protein
MSARKSPLLDICPDLTPLVSYSPQLALALGDVKAALLLCQLVYLQKALGCVEQRSGNAPEGYFFARSGRLLAETGLTVEEQIGARGKLVDLKLIAEEYHRGSRNLYIRVDLKRVKALGACGISLDLKRDERNSRAKSPARVTKQDLDDVVKELSIK